MTNYLAAMAVVAIILIGGTIADHVDQNARQTACERAGWAFVLGTSDFTCAKAMQGARP